ncbi:MAG: hypothetical protein H5T60_03780 [Anaerolineae bacterium]|nr:hypothetical protein [Anaerolineae bacterium]
MEQLLEQVRRLEIHQRIWWQRARRERTRVFETAEEVVQALEGMSGLREVEVYRAGETRYVVYLRD